MQTVIYLNVNNSLHESLRCLKYYIWYLVTPILLFWCSSVITTLQDPAWVLFKTCWIWARTSEFASHTLCKHNSLKGFDWESCWFFATISSLSMLIQGSQISETSCFFLKLPFWPFHWHILSLYILFQIISTFSWLTSKIFFLNSLSNNPSSAQCCVIYSVFLVFLDIQ